MKIGSQPAKSPEDRRLVLIYDLDGSLKAASRGSWFFLGAPAEEGGEPVANQTYQGHFSETFGAGSAVTRWLSEHFAEARNHDEYCVESKVEQDGKALLVRLQALMCAGELYGFAVQISDGDRQATDKPTTVTRQQWHDIKNHLGGLKLYATFLSKKLAAGEDRIIVDKILKGINGLIEHLARIRRGE